MSNIENVDGRKLVSENRYTIQGETQASESTTTSSKYQKGEGYKKVQINLNGEMQAPTDNSLSGSNKTPEQEENLAKLADARNFMKTPDGAKLANILLSQEEGLSKGQKKFLKKQGIDPEAFVQEWNKVHPESVNNKKYDSAKASELKEEMGTLANTHLGVGDNRESSPKSDRELQGRTFMQKLFGAGDKQKVKADEKHGFDTATKVNMHSSTADRKGDIEHVVADEMAQAGEQYLSAFEKTDAKGRKTFKETDENGNIVKTKVVYNKDGSVKKVKTKGDSYGKLVVKQSGDSDISVKGHLNSDFVYEKNPDVLNVNKHTIVKETRTDTEFVERDYETQKIVTKELPLQVFIPEVPVTPEKAPKTPKGGLVMDVIHNSHTSGFGSVSGYELREEFRKYGAADIVKAYCSYDESNVPAKETIQAIMKNSTYSKDMTASKWANIYNAEHIAQALINDAENKTVNEEALGDFIGELLKTKNTLALNAVKETILRHNRNVDEKIANDESNPNKFDDRTKMLHQKVTAKNGFIAFLFDYELK